MFPRPVPEVTFVAFSVLIVLTEDSNTHLFLGHIVVVIRVEGPVGVIEREVFVFIPVDISAATRCL